MKYEINGASQLIESFRKVMDTARTVAIETNCPATVAEIRQDGGKMLTDAGLVDGSRYPSFLIWPDGRIEELGISKEDLVKLVRYGQEFEKALGCWEIGSGQD